MGRRSPAHPGAGRTSVGRASCQMFCWSCSRFIWWFAVSVRVSGPCRPGRPTVRLGRAAGPHRPARPDATRRDRGPCSAPTFHIRLMCRHQTDGARCREVLIVRQVTVAAPVRGGLCRGGVNRPWSRAGPADGNGGDGTVRRPPLAWTSSAASSGSVRGQLFPWSGNSGGRGRPSRHTGLCACRSSSSRRQP